MAGLIIAIARRKPGGSDPADSVGEGDTRASGTDTGRDDLKGEPKDTYTNNIESCLQDLADILHIRDADRSKFNSAMEDLAEAVARRVMDSGEADEGDEADSTDSST